MAHSPSHKPSQSMSTVSQNLLPPQQRRMTLPSGGGRPPSPLRNGFVPDTSTGIDPNSQSDSGSDEDSEDEDFRGRRTSPAPSVSQLAASLANKVGNLVTNTINSPISAGAAASPRPSLAEIEAEAERARDRSRREAERIMSAEVDERRRVEERVLALLHSNPSDNSGHGENGSLPPPRPRSQTVPSPSSSQKDGTSWWSVAKNRLTPTKDPLTPAQQVIQDAKAREKEEKREEKRRAKELASFEKEMMKNKGKEPMRGDWPADPNAKYADPALASMRPQSAALHVPRKPVPSIPESPSPSPGRSMDRDALLLPPRSATSPSPSTPPNSRPNQFSASPVSLSNSNLASPGLLTSPANNPNGRNVPSPSNQGSTSSPRPPASPLPIYASFSPSGTLDIPVTLLTISRRFEKLERWTVGHVRALEDRMGDVEAWLVEREEARVNNKAGSESNDGSEQPKAVNQDGDDMMIKRAMNDMQTDLGELQSRVSMLGREMARIASGAGQESPSPSSYTDARSHNMHSRSPSPSSIHQPSLSFSRRSGPKDKPWGDLQLSAAPSSEVHVREAPRRSSERGLVSESEDETGSIQESEAESEHTRSKGTTTDPIGLGITPMSASFGSFSASPHGRAPSLTARESTSPPLARVSSRGHGPNHHGKSATSSGTRLPYPTGDYAPASLLSPSSTGNSLAGGSAAISTMTPSSPPSASVTRTVTNPGSPSIASGGAGKWSGRPLPASPGQSSAPGSMSVPTGVSSPRLRTSPRPQGSNKVTSPVHSPGASPTPRKRYTVALGVPISRVADSEPESGKTLVESDEDDEDGQEETIGRRASTRVKAAVASSDGNASSKDDDATPKKKPRAHSVYGLSSLYETGPPKPVAPLNPGRLRARSTDRFSISSYGSTTPGERKFVDPYVAKREKEREHRKIAMPKPVGKVPIGDLVAFFDGEKS